MMDIQRFATAWFFAWIGAAFVLVCLAAFGVAFTDARPTPSQFPGRFLIFGICAALVALPGWFFSMYLDE